MNDMSEPQNPDVSPAPSEESFAFDVELENFEARVVQPSHQVPVLIDFWAPWCAPCRTLKPMLESLAQEYAGRFLLARVNVDKYPQLAQHFGVRSIPSVKAMKDGSLADEFSGALPENEVRSFINRLLPAGGALQREQARLLANEGHFEEALTMLVQAMQDNPDDEALRLDAVEVLIELERLEDVQTLLSGEFTQEEDRARTLRARVELISQPIDLDLLARLKASIATDPDDYAARLELSNILAAASDFRAALEMALEVVLRDRSFENDAGRKTMLRIFEALNGNERHNDLIRKFRRRLSAALN